MNYLTTDTDLTAVADAIRAKVGVQGALMYPDDYIDFIDELVKPTGTKTITENGTGIDVASYSKVDVNVSGGGGDGVITTVVLENSSGDIGFGDVLEACENLDYEISYPNSILFFRAKGTNAYSGTTSYTYNNFKIIVKNWVVWNKDYCRNRYKNGKVAPDSFGGTGGIELYESNNPLNGSGIANIIDANRKIKKTYTGNAIGGEGTTVTLYEIPVDWSDFSTTLT